MEHDKELEVEKTHSASLDQEIDVLVSRKEELKHELGDTKEELAQVQDAYR